MNRGRKKLLDCVTKPIHNFVEGSKDFVAKSHFSDFFPDLLNGIHFWSIWRDIKQSNVFWTMKSAGLMPCGAITAEKDNIIWILFCQARQKEIHTIGITTGHNPKTGFSRQWFYSSIYIPIFPYMMARDRGAYSFLAPTIFGLVDSTKARFILEHEPYFSACRKLYFFDLGLNFFEVAM